MRSLFLLRSLCVLLVASALLAPPSALAEGRVALVLGTDRYDHLESAAQLDVAVRDARLIQATLEGLTPAFTVIPVLNATREEGTSALERFADLAKDAECALIYFAGHAIEFHGENYLLCRDTDVDTLTGNVQRMKDRLYYRSLALRRVMEDLEDTGAHLKLIVLDACRDNPLEAQTTAGTRSIVGSRGGLGRVTAPSGMLISYSADAGQQANDGLFTPILAQYLKQPGFSLMQVFAHTRTAVQTQAAVLAREERGVLHEPAEYSKLAPQALDFAFVPDGGGGDREGETTRRMAAMQAELERMQRELAMAKAPKDAPGPPSAIVPPAPSPASTFRAGTTRSFAGIDFVWCPPGEFMMGSPKSEADRDDDETQHRVRLSQGYWLAKTECTQAQWERVMGSNPSQYKGVFKKDKLPVESVSWEDVQGFLDKLNQRSRAEVPAGMRFALPTEAQWEYACRGGSGGAYAGDLDAKGWYRTNAGSKTHPVGGKQANAWGLLDMHGNVYEWCQDWYGDYPSGTVTDPQGPTTGSDRVLRGGSWHGIAENCRPAYRFRGGPSLARHALGFRPAVVPSP